MTQHCNCICLMHLYVLSCCMVLRHGDRGRCAGAVWNHVSLSSGSFFGLSLVCVQALPTRRCWASWGGSLWRTPQRWPSVGSGTGWSRCRTPASACWAAQVCSFLHFTSPIVDGKPQRIDTSAVSAHLQRRMYDAVNGSDLRKVREWLEVRGPVNCDNYQMAHYLQAVASKTSRRRLAQFRMGSHMLGVETGRWLPRAERLCQRCSCSAVDDEAHMIWGCPALIDQRVQHSELFEDSSITSVSDF